MLKYKDYVYGITAKDFYQVINVGKKSYTFKHLQGDYRNSKVQKSTCHKLLERKEWLVGDLRTLELLYGVR